MNHYNDADLIKTLREQSNWLGFTEWLRDLFGMAADRIEALSGSKAKTKNCTGIRCIMQYDKVDPATCKCVSYCPQATPPLTNYDRLIIKSPEELADVIRCPHGICDDVKMNCGKCILDWLKQEAGE